MQKLHIFSAKISINAIFNDQCFNDTLTDDILSFEQLGPGFQQALSGYLHLYFFMGKKKEKKKKKKKMLNLKVPSKFVADKILN